MSIKIQQIFPQIPTFIFWKDLNLNYVGCNSHFAKIVGLTHSNEIAGKTDFDMPWAATQGQLFQDGDREVLDGIPKYGVLEKQLQADGNLVTNVVNKTILYDENNQKIGVIGSYIRVFDYTTQDMVEEFKNKNSTSALSHGLTKRQAQCLFYFAQGMTFKQIARKLYISPKTVEYHMTIIKDKLNCSSRFELISRAYEFGMVNEFR